MSKKISQLPEATSLTGDELVPIVQGGVTKRTTVHGISGDGYYKAYVANLDQTGTSAPVATEHYNTVGITSWVRSGVGDYHAVTDIPITSGVIWIGGTVIESINGSGNYIRLIKADNSLVGVISVNVIEGDEAPAPFWWIQVNTRNGSGVLTELSDLLDLFGSPGVYFSLPEIRFYNV